MATNFPASLDELTNPTSGDGLNSPSHSEQHANANDAIEALETALGTTENPREHSATEKETPADDDELGLVDSAASNVLKKLTWANLKATLKTYFDTLYPAKIVPYKFSAYRAAAWNTPNATTAVVALDTELFDTGNNFNTANGRFVAPVNGYYFIQGKVGAPAATLAAMIVSLNVNGSGVATGNDQRDSGTPQQMGGNVSRLLYLAANDYVELAVYTSAAVTGGTGTHTYMSGFLVSAA